ncbi:hypothetical protein NDU88_004867 [Pleurodeles waltl]|uniref:Uncharacterized protein n=1 Tax=Pleurodeles waltl TaxID=8319 RepID=A0AAV7QHB5_PLEWA|nr:hypothetical protein NDU88_004867 [Pleurodeles waltl]
MALRIKNVINIGGSRGRGLTAGQDGRHLVRLCPARGRLSVLLTHLTVGRVPAGRALIVSAPGPFSAAQNGAKTRAAAERRRGRAHTGCARVCGTQEERVDRGGACAGR